MRAMLYAATIATITVTIAACATGRVQEAATPPAFMLGEFMDDYGSRYRISAGEWGQPPRARYHISKWNVAARYIIAQNDSANPAERGRWTRIDWVQLEGMPPYHWAYCYTVFDAPTAAAAEAAAPALSATPRTGCNGYPFSRMKTAG